MHWGAWDASWWQMVLAMLVFWGGLALLVIGAIRMWGRAGRDRPEADPRRILDERFARGEIGAQEYRERTEVLSSGR